MFPKKILVASDASDEAYPAVEAAVELANGTGSELHVVFVVSTAPELPYPKFTAKERNAAYLEQKRLGGLRLLEHQVRRVEELGGSLTASHYREGKPEREVVRLGREIGAGLIVTGGRRRPWFVRLFGPGFSTKVFRKADRPVMVVGKHGPQNSAVPK
jgi:nucleotide-binding universal stress UspA family protein